MKPPIRYDLVICMIKKLVVQDILGVNYYQVNVEAHAANGHLLCRKTPILMVGQVFTAQFIAIDHNGDYLLQNVMIEKGADGKFHTKSEFEPPSLPGGGKLIDFPVRQAEE